jgi:hypothetical protein
MNEWREEQSKILSQIRAHQMANHDYLEEGIRVLELASNCRWDGVTPCPGYRKPFDILAEGLSSANWLPKQVKS